jgi:hypothetical protein
MKAVGDPEVKLHAILKMPAFRDIAAAAAASP